MCLCELVLVYLNCVDLCESSSACVFIGVTDSKWGFVVEAFMSIEREIHGVTITQRKATNILSCFLGVSTFYQIASE